MADIIVKDRNSMDRAIRDATAAVVEADRAAYAGNPMPQMTDEGLYDIPAMERPRPLTAQGIRALAETYRMCGIDDVRVAVRENGNGGVREIDVTFVRGEKKRTCSFSCSPMPDERRVRGNLSDLGEAMRG